MRTGVRRNAFAYGEKEAHAAIKESNWLRELLLTSSNCAENWE